MKKIFSIFMICILSCTFFGCNSNGVSSNGQTKIFASISHIDPFISTITDSMKSYAEKNNVKLDFNEADNNVETQVEQIKEAKDKGYDAIICLLVDSETSQQIINAAGKLPVIFINVQPDKNRLRKNKDIYVALNEQEVVKYSVEYLKKYFKDKKSFDAVMFEGDRNNKSSVVRTDNLKFELKKNGFDINYVFEDEAGWSRQTAKEMFKTFLKLNKNYDCIMCNNDEMALGVIDAMNEEGIDPSKVPILGVDAEKEACQAILDGKMQFTLKQSGKGQGESAVKAAVALKNGKDLSTVENADKSGMYIWYPYKAVDKSNAAKFVN